MQTKVFVGTFVDFPQLDEIRIAQDYVLVIGEKGHISDFCSRSSVDGNAIIQHSTGLREPIFYLPQGYFFIPSFCDLHVHAPQFLYQGTGLDLPLMEWLDKYAFKAEECIDLDANLARKVYTRLATRLKENGTGAVLLFGTIKTETNLILAEVMQQARIRAFIGKLSMDQSSRDTYSEGSTASALESAEIFIERCRAIVSHLPTHEQLVEPVITPRFVPTCSNELLLGLGKLSHSTGVRIQSHISEARDQVDWVRRERGCDDVTIFDQSSLLNHRSIQAHCTFLTDESLKLFRDRGTSIAHCPLSNAYFSSQPFRLREALDIGVKIGLGTDVAGGYSLDIMNAMRSAVMVSRMREGQQTEEFGVNKSLRIDWIAALHLATLGGAKVLDLPKGTGTFSIGAPFDAQLIQFYDHESCQGVGTLDFLYPSFDGGVTAEVVEKWWSLGDTRNRKGSWVQGQQS